MYEHCSEIAGPTEPSLTFFGIGDTVDDINPALPIIRNIP